MFDLDPKFQLVVSAVALAALLIALLVWSPTDVPPMP